MTQTQIEYFEKVYELRNIAKAAEELLVTRSVISRMISGLEDELGVELFERSKNGVVPTEAGEQIHVALKGIRNDYLVLMSRVRSISENSDKRSLKIGVTQTNINVFYDVAYAAFREAHPDIGVEFYEASARTVCDMLYADELDAGFCPGPQIFRHYPGMEGLKICYVRISLGVSEDSPLASREMLDVTDICNIPLALLGSEFPGEPMLADACEAISHHKPDIKLRTNSTELLRRLTVSGEVCPLIPDNMMRRWENIKIVPVAFIPAAAHYLCWNSKLRISDELNTFIDFIKTNSDKIN